jgi:hypothetical protein
MSRGILKRLCVGRLIDGDVERSAASCFLHNDELAFEESYNRCSSSPAATAVRHRQQGGKMPKTLGFSIFRQKLKNLTHVEKTIAPMNGEMYPTR